MRKLTAAAVLAASVSTVAPAQAPNPPKLIVVISVDQFAADLFDMYRPHFTAGLGRLASQGAVFRNGYQGQAATETCPGHSTILTGALPARTGIIANTWIDQSIGREDKTVYCAEDERAAGTSSTSYKVSSVHLKVPTLGDVLKKLSPDSQNVAVAGKDRAAVMMSGHAADQRWFWKDDRFVTDLDTAPVPKAVPLANAAIARLIAAGEPALQPPPLCLGRERQFVLTPSLSVGTGRFARPPGDAAGFRVSPSLDGATLALAAGLVEEMRLGRDRAPDVLSIGLSATDYVGHAYGNGGEEMCLNLLSLDRELGDFFEVLDRDGIDYAVVLTADHGGADIPERQRVNGAPQAVRADPALAPDALGKVIAQKLGLSEPVLLGSVAGDVYLRKGLTSEQATRALQEARRFYSAHPQVQGVFGKEELEAVALPSGAPDKWTLIQRARASFDTARSGDLVVMLKPGVTPIPLPSKGYAATHGTPWDYDRRVPIVFWRRGAAGGTQDRPIDTVDIMPTLAAAIGLPLQSASIDGHCVDGVIGITCPKD